jgi:hypothetical protein
MKSREKNFGRPKTGHSQQIRAVNRVIAFPKDGDSCRNVDCQ